MKKMISTMFVCSAFLVGSAAFAKPAVLSSFKVKYPTAKTLFTCKTCHDATPKLNYYGMELQKSALDFAAFEAVDSDGDGKTNLEEITAGTNPGVKN